jgi:protein-disulfide isomerase
MLEANEGLMLALGLHGTPGIVYAGPDGRPVARGGLPAEELPAVLGPR